MGLCPKVHEIRSYWYFENWNIGYFWGLETDVLSIISAYIQCRYFCGIVINHDDAKFDNIIMLSWYQNNGFASTYFAR